jgi:hypothetical protein
MKYLLISNTTLDRWKRLIARGETKAVWQEIEAFRARGGDHE